jgi:phosphohistidine phosphatase SixA
MTITYNPNNGDIYVVQGDKVLHSGKGRAQMTYRELLAHLVEKEDEVIYIEEQRQW